MQLCHLLRCFFEVLLVYFLQQLQRDDFGIFIVLALQQNLLILVLHALLDLLEL